jgi:hypothetical protein
VLTFQLNNCKIHLRFEDVPVKERPVDPAFTLPVDTAATDVPAPVAAGEEPAPTTEMETVEPAPFCTAAALLPGDPAELVAAALPESGRTDMVMTDLAACEAAAVESDSIDDVGLADAILEEVLE